MLLALWDRASLSCLFVCAAPCPTNVDCIDCLCNRSAVQEPRRLWAASARRFQDHALMQVFSMRLSSPGSAAVTGYDSRLNALFSFTPLDTSFSAHSRYAYPPFSEVTGVGTSISTASFDTVEREGPAREARFSSRMSFIIHGLLYTTVSSLKYVAKS